MVCHFLFHTLAAQIMRFFYPDSYRDRDPEYQMRNCNYCNQVVVRAGQQKNGAQKYQCKGCKKYQQRDYQYKACNKSINQNVVHLLIEGIGINKSYSFVKNGIYEIDELWTFIGSKANEIWITYSFERKSKKVIDFKVGARTKESLQKITDGVLQMNPDRICTDGLNTYKSLIPKPLHRIGLPNTRHIERFNLNLRTHLKRLSRKTICFSKSKEMLEACLKIYIFGSIDCTYKMHFDRERIT